MNLTKVDNGSRYVLKHFDYVGDLYGFHLWAINVDTGESVEKNYKTMQDMLGEWSFGAAPRPNIKVYFLDYKGDVQSAVLSELTQNTRRKMSEIGNLFFTKCEARSRANRLKGE